MAKIQISELEGLTQSEQKLVLAAIYDAAAPFVEADVPQRKNDEPVESFLGRAREFYEKHPELDPREDRPI